jgi:hypothetical protein
MTEPEETPGWKSSSRGESAWKEARERVAARNEQTRKAGKVERQTHEREREEARRRIAKSRR